MNALINTFWQICRFRMGPQDIPFSAPLLWMVVVAYVVISTCVAGFNLSPIAAVMSSMLDAGIIAGLTRMILWVREQDARMTQTTTALLGTGVIFGFFAVPLMWWQLSFEDPTQAIVPSMIMLALLFWNLSVIGHILRHALNIPYFVGVLLSIMYMYVSVSVIRAFFVVPTAGQ